MRQQLKKPLLVSLLGGVACFAASALAAQSVQIIDFSKPEFNLKLPE